ncbi:MAG: hypothetical protein IT536_00485 [Hyphomicrobiales bacterium]|nr:hypothetical protein [Hyphomicrobiales bacterium]
MRVAALRARGCARRFSEKARGGMAIIDDIKAIVANSLKVPVEQLKDDSTLEAVGAASIDIIEIIYELEEKFDIDISGAAKAGRIPGAEKGEDMLNQVVDMSIAQLAEIVQGLVESKTC